MLRFKLDAASPPQLTASQAALLDAMDDPSITRAAQSDVDNPPLSDAELNRMAASRVVKQVRARTGLSQQRFAEAFDINIGRLRDLEQGRSAPDSAFLAYLTVIDREPDAVKRALR